MHLNALECYTCICLGYGISHDVSDVAAQQVRPERSGDSCASEQDLSLPNKAVQRSLVRHNTAPLHRPPSPSTRRRRTVCKESGTYTSLHLSHTYMCILALTLPRKLTYIHTHMQPHCRSHAVHVLHLSDSFVSQTGFQRFSLTQHSLGVDGQCHQCIQLCSQCNAYSTCSLVHL